MRLTVRNIVKRYVTREKNKPEIYALDNVSFTLNSGEFCGVVGESGSGKSTLAHIITGLIPADSGKILLDEKALSPVVKSKELCKKIQLVLQDSKSALDPHFTIYKCIAEPIRNLCKVTREKERHRVLELIRQTELTEDILKRKPYELSGGQQKRVCIARALAAEPEIIIFDEAVSGIDVIMRKNILELLKKVHRESGCTVLFITHDIDAALYMSSRIIVMKDGKIIENVKNNGAADCLMHPYSRMLVSAMLPEKDIPAQMA